MSWFKLNLSLQSTFPDIQDIQTSLVKIGDKPASFLHSHDWIGSVEVGLVLQDFTNVSDAPRCHAEGTILTQLLACHAGIPDSTSTGALNSSAVKTATTNSKYYAL